MEKKEKKMHEREKSELDIFDEHYRSHLCFMKKNNPMLNELGAMDKLLDEMPEVLKKIQEDLNKGIKSQRGRESKINAEQSLRCAVLMIVRQYKYRELAYEVEGNLLYRQFTRFYGAEIPHFTTIERAIKSIGAETVEEINKALVGIGIKKNIEDGKSLRHDTTVVETNIAYPVDARLLNDSVRVITRLLEEIGECREEEIGRFRNQTRRSKKRAYQIVVGKGKNIEKRRKDLYRDLLKVQRSVRGEASLLLGYLPEAIIPKEKKLCVQIEEVLTLSKQIYEQAYRRVIKGESVSADEKLVSLFETHTDIICRGKKGSKVEFGHKVDIGTGRSGLIVRYEILEGNPGDNEILERVLDDHKQLFGKAPRDLTTDRRYFSAANEAMAREKGVQNIAMPKPGKLSGVRKAIQNSNWFRRLMRGEQE